MGPCHFCASGMAPGAIPSYPLDGRPGSIGSGPAENELTITSGSIKSGSGSDDREGKAIFFTADTAGSKYADHFRA